MFHMLSFRMMQNCTSFQWVAQWRSCNRKHTFWYLSFESSVCAFDIRNFRNHDNSITFFAWSTQSIRGNNGRSNNSRSVCKPWLTNLPMKSMRNEKNNLACILFVYFTKRGGSFKRQSILTYCVNKGKVTQISRKSISATNKLISSWFRNYFESHCTYC